jgi:hypothetical protein
VPSWLTLGRLPGVEAWQLLAGRVGDHRLASEPGPVQEIIARCAGLPLALAIVAARAAAHPGFALAELADELAGVGDGLDAFDGADPVTGLRAVFSWSYRTLAPPAARLFRVLGLHPGPDLSGPAVASLAGIPAARAGRLLADLTRAHLLSEHRPAGTPCTTCCGRTPPNWSVRSTRRNTGRRPGTASWTTTCTPPTPPPGC